MKFNYKDEIDKMVVKVTVHEFSRCTLAFNSFIRFSEKSYRDIQSTLNSVLRYNSYALFIQHLYEYLVSCMKRDRNNTKEIPNDQIDILINIEVNKILRNMRLLIDNKMAPSWVNDRSYYEEDCPINFATDFRQIRNSLSHADYRRINGGNRITLTEFYKKYHKYIMLLYQNGRELWSIQNIEKIDLGDVTEFNRITFQ